MPGTNRPVTKSFEDRLRIAEFDDSLIDMHWWAGPRYKGVKATGQRINEYNEGDQTYGLNPVVQNETTAIYIANTVIGGEEDYQFATIKNHSYVGINKIVNVDINDDSVEILDRNVEGYEEFHRFITNDLPTGASFNIKVLDESISTNLKNLYYAKMNKGWLLKSFDYRFQTSSAHLSANNSMYLYKDGLEEANRYVTGSSNSNSVEIANTPSGSVRFRYAVIEMFNGTTNGKGDLFQQQHMGPCFTSSSIVSNKFTRQFYSGAFGFVQNDFIGATNTHRLETSDLAGASRFIGINCLDFLRLNNSDNSLEEQEKTEMHITFLDGEKDFSISISGSGSAGDYSYNRSANDERSIGTFEIDPNAAVLDLGDHCHSWLPQSHEISLKSPNDSRFTPAGTTFQDRFDNGYLQHTGSENLTTAEKIEIANVEGGAYGGCEAYNTIGSGKLQDGVNLSRIDDAKIYIQGGDLGPVGFDGCQSRSKAAYGDAHSNQILMSADNYYSGSFRYDISFLDKDHVIVADIDKDAELFDGIGTKGVAIIPSNMHQKVKQNLEIYLKKAGLITQAPTTFSKITRRESVPKTTKTNKRGF